MLSPRQELCQLRSDMLSDLIELRMAELRYQPVSEDAMDAIVAECMEQVEASTYPPLPTLEQQREALK